MNVDLNIPINPTENEMTVLEAEQQQSHDSD